jgi:hypothetical protein
MSEFELNEEDVISVHPEDSEENDNGNPVGKDVFLLKHLVEGFEVSNRSSRGWHVKGFQCHCLRPGEQWKKGKIFLRAYFVPDEPEDETQQAQLEDSETLFLPSSDA